MGRNFALTKKFEEIEKKHWWWNGRRKLIKIFLPDREKLKILDVGCGTGETLAYLGSIRPDTKLFGIDPDPIAVGFSKSRNCGVIIKARAEKLPFHKNYFDVIMLLDVLEHIKDQNKALLESKRVLKKGGIIIITAPALKMIWSDHDIKQDHFRRYNRREVRSLAKTMDMELEFLSYFNFLLSPPIIAIRLLSKFKPLKFLVSYNNRVNYDIAKVGFINSLLTGIFLAEIGWIKRFRYPIGISLVAVLGKK